MADEVFMTVPVGEVSVVDAMLIEIARRITPVLPRIYAESYSGEIRLRFQNGRFKEAVRTEVRL